MDILRDPKDRRAFCREMDRMFRCRDSQCNPEVRNCDLLCPFKTACDVQAWCNGEGITIRAALERWASKAIDEPLKLTILADSVGVEVRALKELIAVLKAAHGKGE